MKINFLDFLENVKEIKVFKEYLDLPLQVRDNFKKEYFEYIGQKVTNIKEPEMETQIANVLSGFYEFQENAININEIHKNTIRFTYINPINGKEQKFKIILERE